MELIGSTKHFTPLASKTMSPARSSFSMSRLYWKPEHPPPTTATRRPEPARFSRSIVSRTMAAALSVRRTGVCGCEGVEWLCSVWVSMGSEYSGRFRIFLRFHCPATDWMRRRPIRFVLAWPEKPRSLAPRNGEEKQESRSRRAGRTAGCGRDPHLGRAASFAGPRSARARRIARAVLLGQAAARAVRRAAPLQPRLPPRSHADGPGRAHAGGRDQGRERRATARRQGHPRVAAQSG